MPELSTARELREQRFKLVKDAHDLFNKPNKTAEDDAKFDQMMAEADGLKVKIDRHERADAADAELRGAGAPPNGQPSGSPDDEEAIKREEKRYRQTWVKYLKMGWDYKPGQRGEILGLPDEDKRYLVNRRAKALDPETFAAVNREIRAMGGKELRDMGTGGGGAGIAGTTGGGFFVPVGFIYDVEEALKYFGPMMKGGVGYPTIFDTATGQVLPYPTSNDTAIVGELIGEGVQATTQDVTIGSVNFSSYKFSSKVVKVSIELLQDSAFDLEQFLIKQFGIRLGRVINQYMTTGSGTNQPNGIVTAATAGPTAVGSSGNDGSSAGANTIGSDDLIALEHSVDPWYRPGAKFLMHDSTLKQIKQLKDKYGRPLWLPGLAVRAEDTILQYGYDINNDMDQQQTSSSSPVVSRKTVLFGQLPKYMIRRVRDMSVLRLEERFADYGQVAFLAFYRADGQLIDAGTHPVKYLVNAF